MLGKEASDNMASCGLRWKTREYTKLDVRKEQADESNSTPAERGFSWKPIFILVAAWMCTIITGCIFSFQLGQRSSSSYSGVGSTSIASYNCGNSSAEARRKGCVFDIMNRGWFPPACYDHSLTAEYDALGEALGGWKWYLNREGSEAISREVYEAGEGPNPLFVTQELHLWHCAFQWRKYHRAVERNTPIDSYMGSYNHTRHCSKILALHKEHEGAAIEFYLTFPDCPAWS